MNGYGRIKYKVVNEEGMTLWYFRGKYSANEMVKEMNRKFPGREFKVENVTTK